MSRRAFAFWAVSVHFRLFIWLYSIVGIVVIVSPPNTRARNISTCSNIVAHSMLHMFGRRAAHSAGLEIYYWPLLQQWPDVARREQMLCANVICNNVAYAALKRSVLLAGSIILQFNARIDFLTVIIRHSAPLFCHACQTLMALKRILWQHIHHNPTCWCVGNPFPKCIRTCVPDVAAEFPSSFTEVPEVINKSNL